MLTRDQPTIAEAEQGLRDAGFRMLHVFDPSPTWPASWRFVYWSSMGLVEMLGADGPGREELVTWCQFGNFQGRSGDVKYCRHSESAPRQPGMWW